MADTQEELKGFMIKAGIYVGGIILGLGAKLVYVSNDRKLTMGEFFKHSIIAFASAYMVWNLLSYYGKLEIANVVSVIVGRYGDAILYAVWGKVKEFMKSKKNEE